MQWGLASAPVVIEEPWSTFLLCILHNIVFIVGNKTQMQVIATLPSAKSVWVPKPN